LAVLLQAAEALQIKGLADVSGLSYHDVRNMSVCSCVLNFQMMSTKMHERFSPGCGKFQRTSPLHQSALGFQGS
jgi:hypothetical protein